MAKEENRVETTGSHSEAKPKKETKRKVEVQKFPDIEGKFLLIKVGTNEMPASEADIHDVEEKLNNFLVANGVNCLAFVTHHAVEIQIIEKQPESS